MGNKKGQKLVWKALRMREDLLDLLGAYCDANGKTMASVGAAAIVEYLEKQERKHTK